MLGRSHWGKGYAYEAATAALDTAFEDLSLDEVISLVRPGNDRSEKLAKLLGGTNSGTIVVAGVDVLIYRYIR